MLNFEYNCLRIKDRLQSIVIKAIDSLLILFNWWGPIPEFLKLDIRHV